MDGKQNSFDTISQTVVLHLNKSDDVTVKHTAAGTDLDGYNHCIFSGFLLYQDGHIDPEIVGK